MVTLDDNFIDFQWMDKHILFSFTECTHFIFVFWTFDIRNNEACDDDTYTNIQQIN